MMKTFVTTFNDSANLDLLIFAHEDQCSVTLNILEESSTPENIRSLAGSFGLFPNDLDVTDQLISKLTPEDITKLVEKYPKHVEVAHKTDFHNIAVVPELVDDVALLLTECTYR